MDLSSMREEYVNNGLRRKDLDDNPIKQFETWFEQAMKADLIEPNAMSLATVGNDMMPSIRTVLLKFFDESGFVFFSNYESVKAKNIQENSKVALHFAWLGLERQVKIEGKAEKISSSKSLKYFLSRPKGSQIGAWVSQQSQVVSSRSVLEAKFNEIKSKFVKGEIPFPSFWGGYIVKPEKIEFWQGAKHRLHDRFQYMIKSDGTWQIDRLAP
ncbi:pyridoxamine 5'-phosphate oxidase [Malaciobacter halophilus]|uniref:Pyridoxamine 5'-phosphate oxidase n=1 Tax=Malaciobacter halophilus TaxID=197482 RepID=A0A2N1J6S9_9BACT|nr:pyridoxamine 5'-phosphate oxidase [Malaciobacter halophilus]AXH10019.1 pyridoxine 5'-phosphate oxidase / pyridoxamine 5'-phosphate oxidase [Malaciobacter halophilus]PKI82234.1 pyridoxamine 5'-phosphate oxidase [Malaciobacter halophilus]